MVLLSVFGSSASGVAAVNEQLSSKVSVDKTESADEDRMVSGIHSAQAVGDEIERESKWKYILAMSHLIANNACTWYGLNSRGMADLEFSECTERMEEEKRKRKHVVCGCSSPFSHPQPLYPTTRFSLRDRLSTFLTSGAGVSN